MGEIIKFPIKNNAPKLSIEKLLEDMDYPSEELKECVLLNAAPVLEKYRKLPDHSFTIELPLTLNKNDIDLFTKSIQDEVIKYAQKIQREMMLEIARLYVELCKCDIKNR